MEHPTLLWIYCSKDGTSYSKDGVVWIPTKEIVAGWWTFPSNQYKNSLSNWYSILHVIIFACLLVCWHGQNLCWYKAANFIISVAWSAKWYLAGLSLTYCALIINVLFQKQLINRPLAILDECISNHYFQKKQTDKINLLFLKHLTLMQQCMTETTTLQKMCSN